MQSPILSPMGVDQTYHAFYRTLLLKTESGQRWIALRQQRGVPEAIAWLLNFPPDDMPLFISCDQKARQSAEQHGVHSTDVMGMVVQAIEHDIFTKEEARTLLQVWNDRQQQRCRPSDFTNFDEIYEKRRTIL